MVSNISTRWNRLNGLNYFVELDASIYARRHGFNHHCTALGLDPCRADRWNGVDRCSSRVAVGPPGRGYCDRVGFRLGGLAMVDYDRNHWSWRRCGRSRLDLDSVGSGCWGGFMRCAGQLDLVFNRGCCGDGKSICTSRLAVDSRSRWSGTRELDGKSRLVLGRLVYSRWARSSCWGHELALAPCFTGGWRWGNSSSRFLGLGANRSCRWNRRSIGRYSLAMDGRRLGLRFKPRRPLRFSPMELVSYRWSYRNGRFSRNRCVGLGYFYGDSRHCSWDWRGLLGIPTRCIRGCNRRSRGNYIMDVAYDGSYRGIRRPDPRDVLGVGGSGQRFGRWRLSRGGHMALGYGNYSRRNRRDNWSDGLGLAAFRVGHWDWFCVDEHGMGMGTIKRDRCIWQSLTRGCMDVDSGVGSRRGQHGRGSNQLDVGGDRVGTGNWQPVGNRIVGMGLIRRRYRRRQPRSGGYMGVDNGSSSRRKRIDLGGRRLVMDRFRMGASSIRDYGFYNMALDAGRVACGHGDALGNNLMELGCYSRDGHARCLARNSRGNDPAEID